MTPPFEAVFVTGATGFIGERLCLALAESGVRVRALARSVGKAQRLVEAGVELVMGDVMVPTTYAQAVEDVDVVFHLAGVLKAPWRRSFTEVNAEGPRRVAETCAAVAQPPALVVVSSLAAGGPSPAGIARDESMPLEPVSKYGRVKLAGERAAAALAHQLSIAVLRPPMVFGPGDQSTLGLFRMADLGFVLLPTRRPSRLSLVHVDDVVSALMAIGARARRREAGGVDAYYIGADERPTFEELARRIATACGRPQARVIRLPRALTYLAALVAHGIGRLLDHTAILNLDKYREAVAGDWTCDPRRLHSELGWRPGASLDTRLTETVESYRRQGDLKKR